MATFIHVTDERVARRILRGGIHATVFTATDQHIKTPRRGVFCVPVVPIFKSTFQWLRELKRSGYSRACGIQVRIDNAESVFVGHYCQRPQKMTATLGWASANAASLLHVTAQLRKTAPPSSAVVGDIRENAMRSS